MIDDNNYKLLYKDALESLITVLEGIIKNNPNNKEAKIYLDKIKERYDKLQEMF